MTNNRKLRLLLYIYIFSQVGFYIFSPLYALFAKSINITPRYIGFIWSAYSFLTAIFILIFGKFENHRRKEKFIKVGVYLYPIADLLFLTVHSAQGLLFVLAINALGAGITFPALKTMFARNQNRGKESEEWSWMDSSNMFAGAVGAAIGGVVISIYGFSGLFITMAIVQFLAATIAHTALRYK
ncbi:MAG: MFS transporter [Candidatus Saccharimonadales bacterium]